ncbi:MAG: FHA domain-containing protein [Burkholderiaceae bacterium]
MAKLILSFENTVLKTVKLDKERVTIGRRPDNDIQVDNLGVSGEHAVVTTLLNDCVIEDMNSTNGTLVNGQPITKHLLQDNDVIEVGKHKLKFVVEAAVAAPAYTNFEKTMVIRRPTAGAPNAAPAPQNHADLEPNTVGLKPAVAPAAPKPAAPVVKAPTVPHTPPAAPAAAVPVRSAAVQVLSGNAVGRVVDLTKPLTSIGKAGVQVAVLTRRPNGFFITHVEGATFPTVNGAPIGKQAQLLNENDTIEIAGIKMTFFYKS